MIDKGFALVSRRFGVLGTMVFGLLLAAGCGKSSGTIFGKVTYKGEPVLNATITFLTTKADSHGQKEFTVPLKDDGTYVVSGVPDGQATVTITNQTNTLATQMASDEMAKMKGAPRDYSSKMTVDPRMKEELEKMRAKAKSARPVPQKYADARQSGLSYDVKPGKHTDVNFDLK